MDTRRSFLRTAVGVASAGLAVPRFDLAAAERALAGAARSGAQDDEAYWAGVRRAYTQDPGFVNLESGFFSPAPDPVVEGQVRQIRRINRMPSFYMRRLQDQERNDLKAMIGRFAGVDPGEFTIARNTTEALNTIIHGVPLDPGDEFVYCSREYPNMQEALEQRAERYGTVNRVIDLPWMPQTQDEVVRAYAEAIGPRTRYLLVSHVIYLTGQVLPVRQICDMAHARGVEVIVDGAHAFAHLDQRIPDLHADYYGTSLHKWLGAPLGTGLMHIRREHIEKVWPLFGDVRLPKDDIRKFEHIGTHPRGTDLAIADAIKFHEAVGGDRKERRLRFLARYWVDRVQGLPGVRINTPLGDGQSCAIANVLIDGMVPADLVDALWDRYRIFTVAVEQGARIAPNLFTGPRDLDRFVAAMGEIVRNG